MKKASAALAIALIGALCTTTTHAQDGKSVRFGLLAAPHMAWLKSDTKGLSNDGSVLGFKFGLMGDFMIGANQNYAFATGLYYMVATGVKVKAEDGSDREGSELKLSYVQLPLTMKLKTNEIGYMTYYGQIGADLGLNTSAKVDGEDVSDAVNTFRAGLVVGAGLEYNISGNTSLMAGITYNNGLTNLYSNDDSAGDAKGKLNYLELTLGVFF